MTYADKKRIADLDEFWDEANSEEPTSSVYLHTFADGRLSMWIEGDRERALVALVKTEKVLFEAAGDGELH